MFIRPVCPTNNVIGAFYVGRERNVDVKATLKHCSSVECACIRIWRRARYININKQ